MFGRPCFTKRRKCQGVYFSDFLPAFLVARSLPSPALPPAVLETQDTAPSGVKTEEIRKGRILADLRDIWRVCLEILPLHKSKEKP